MADPFSISVGALSLLGAVTKLSLELPKIIADFRQAGEDVSLVRRELESLSGPLSQLKTVKIFLPDDLQQSLKSTLDGCEAEVENIRTTLLAATTGRGRSFRWVISGKTDVNRRRGSLEAHKSALQLALTLNGLSLSTDIKNDTQKVLGEIDQLRNDINRNARSEMLLRYLDASTTYTESVYEGSTVDLENLKDDTSDDDSQTEEQQQATPTASRTDTTAVGVSSVSPSPTTSERWNQIRQNAAARALAQQNAQKEKDEVEEWSDEETIEARVAKIKARLAELTGNMDIIQKKDN